MPTNLTFRYQHIVQKMASQLIFSCIFVAVLLPAASASSGGNYNYTGAGGLANWGEKFPDCKNGKHQSPINIIRKDVVHSKELNHLVWHYKPAKASLVNMGVSIEAIFDDHVGSLVVDGKNYTLKQIHWHTPSEHQIDGVNFAAELHLFHVADDKKGNAVVSILYQLGAPDPLLSKISKNLDELAKHKGGHEEAGISLGIVDSKLLMENGGKYYRYMGSRTTPPCSEDVIWNVFEKVGSISKEQLAALEAPLSENCKDNHRPLQPLNGRKIVLYN